MERWIVYSTDREFKKNLIIVDAVKSIYFNFEWDKKIEPIKWDELIWYCSEDVWRDGYCEFKKLWYEYQRDIVECIIGIKKREWKYTLFQWDES